MAPGKRITLLASSELTGMSSHFCSAPRLGDGWGQLCLTVELGKGEEAARILGEKKKQGKMLMKIPRSGQGSCSHKASNKIFGLALLDKRQQLFSSRRNSFYPAFCSSVPLPFPPANAQGR